jgi:O-antigen ligase
MRKLKLPDQSVSRTRPEPESRRVRSWSDLILQALLGLLVLAALLAMQALIGGTRLIYALPAYAILAAAGSVAACGILVRRPSPSGSCLIGSAIFFGYIIIRAAISPAPYLARIDIISVLGGLVLYLLVSCLLTNAKVRMWIFAGLLLAALAHVFVGVIQFRTGDNFMPIPFLQRFDYGRRASGFYICPNHLAGLLEVLGVFAISIVCWSRWPVWGKMLIGYAAVACYLGVLVTGSRGGYLSTAVSLLVFAVLSGRALAAARGSNLLLKVGAATLLAGLVGIGSAVFFVRHSDVLVERTSNAMVESDFRFTLWQAAVKQWALSPVIGTGSRTYMYYGRLFRAERMQRDPIYAHSDYLQLLADYGAAGALGFLIFLGVHLRQGLKDAARLGPKRIALSPRLTSNALALNLGALGAMGAYAAHSVVDFNLHIPANVLLMAFAFGIVANAGVMYEPGIPPLGRSLLGGRALLFVLALALGWQIWRMGPREFYAEQARVALRDNRFLSAVDYATRAVKADPTNPEAFYYLGRSRILGGDLQDDPDAADSFYKAAISPLERAIELAPMDETYPIELALTYDELDRYSEAEWLYGVAMRLDPRSYALRRYYQAHLDRWKNGETIPDED